MNHEKLGWLFRVTLGKTKLVPEGDYRDWEAIRAWAREVASALTGSSATAER
ncbi:MAG: hypothetical protein ACOX9A_10285 [Anaerolineae bacterium]|jgi:menaquinone-dependent protoporphyrinogen IX oxidase